MATIVGSAGGGNWNATGSWVGGVVPGSGDDVQLNATSGSITVNVTSACRSLDCTGYTGTLARGVNSFTIGDGTAGLGNIALKLVSTMSITGSASVTFASTSATQQTIAMGTKTFSSTTIFSGVGGSWQLQDAFGGTLLSHTGGTLDLNGQSLTLTNGFSCTGSNVRALICGIASITLAGATNWTVSGSNFTVSAASATISMAGNAIFAGAGASYGALVNTLAGTSAFTIQGANTFGSLSVTGTTSKTGSVTFSANQTITGTLTINGNNVTNRLLVASDTLGTPRTISAGSIATQHTDWQDINNPGTTWDLRAITGNSGDCGGNTGITFTAPTTQTATGIGSFTWSIHGWTTHVPLPQDTVVIPNAFVSATITCDMPRLGKDVTFSCTGNPSLTNNTQSTVYGSLILAVGMTITTGTGILFGGRGTHTITTNGVLIHCHTNFLAFGGTYTLQDDWLCTATTWNMTLTNGSLDSNGFAVQAGTFFSSATTFTRALTMRTSTWTLRAAPTFWSVVTSGLTLSAASATIVVGAASASGRTFAGGGLTYGTLTYTAAGSTGALTITGNNTFVAINFSDATNARTLTLTGTTQTVTGSINGIVGTAGKLMTITGGTITKASGLVSTDYLNLAGGTTATSGGALFFAGSHSTNTSSSGWIIADLPAPSTKTQSATARMAATLTKTQTARAYTVITRTATQTATARTSKNLTKTQSATAHVLGPIVATPSGGDWNDTTTWVGGVVPTSADDVQLRASSGDVTLATRAYSDSCRSLDCTGYSGTLTVDNILGIGDATAGLGNIALKLSPTMTVITTSAGEFDFQSDSATVQSVRTASVILPITLSFNTNVAGSWQLQDDLTIDQYSAVKVIQGTFDTNNKSVTSGYFQCGQIDAPFTVLLGTTTWTLTVDAYGAYPSWYAHLRTASSLSAAAATIVVQPAALGTTYDGSFYGGGFSYGVLRYNASSADTGKLTIQDSNTFDTLNVANAGGSRILVFAAGTTQTVTHFNVNGTVAHGVTFSSDTSGSPATIDVPAGVVSVDYLSIKDSTTVGTTAFYAGAHSTDVSGNTGWTFTAPPVIVTKTQTARARISKTFTKTQSAQAHISVVRTATQSVVARIQTVRTATQTARAWISAPNRFAKTQTATARISCRLHVTQTSTARIAISTFSFQPPVSSELPRTLARPGRDDRFWNYIRRGPVGASVLKHHDGTYEVLSYPSQDQIAAAERIYMGGNVYPITKAERDSLVTAGFSVDELVQS